MINEQELMLHDGNKLVEQINKHFITFPTYEGTKGIFIIKNLILKSVKSFMSTDGAVQPVFFKPIFKEMEFVSKCRNYDIIIKSRIFL